MPSPSQDASISKSELTAIVALMFAFVALSIDAMLPALPNIASELMPQDANRAQLVLTSFLLGMGVGLLFAGPVSDALGRRPAILVGTTLYAISALIAAMSNSAETLFVSRFFMGICAAAPRIVGLAVVRDLFKGREMAQIMSYVLMIFTLIPAIAPMLGAAILTFSTWRSIFVLFIVFALTIFAWVGLRLPETLPPVRRRSLSFASIGAATRELLSHPVARSSIIIQSLVIGILFAMLTSIQQVYEVVFDRAESFPYWFALVAIVSGTGSLINGKLVPHLGMRKIVIYALSLQSGFGLIMVAASFTLPPDQIPFALFVLWQCSVFLMLATTLGNLNAMAMEPVGHIAGLAASVIGAISTIFGVVLATPLGQLFDGTLRPLAVGIFLLALCAVFVMRSLLQDETKELPAE